MAASDEGAPREVMTAADAARVLGISRQRVSALHKGGALPGYKDRWNLWLFADAVRQRAAGVRRTPPGRLSVADIAAVLGVSPNTVTKYHRRGLLRGGEKKGNFLSFPADVLDGFVRPVAGIHRRKQPYNSSFRRPKS